MKESKEKWNNKMLKRIRKLDLLIKNSNDVNAIEKYKIQKENTLSAFMVRNWGLIEKATNRINDNYEYLKEDFKSEFICLFLDCVNKYDFNKQMKFSSYFLTTAAWKFNKYLELLVGDKSQRDYELLWKYCRCIDEYRSKHFGELPAREEINHYMNIGKSSFERVEQLYSMKSVSLEYENGKDNINDITLKEYIADHKIKSPDYILIKRNFWRKVFTFYCALPYKEKKIFLYKLGFSKHNNKKDFCEDNSIGFHEFERLKNKVFSSARNFFYGDKEILKYLCRN